MGGGETAAGHSSKAAAGRGSGGRVSSVEHFGQPPVDGLQQSEGVGIIYAGPCLQLPLQLAPQSGLLVPAIHGQRGIHGGGWRRKACSLQSFAGTHMVFGQVQQSVRVQQGQRPPQSACLWHRVRCGFGGGTAWACCAGHHSGIIAAYPRRPRHCPSACACEQHAREMSRTAALLEALGLLAGLAPAAARFAVGSPMAGTDVYYSSSSDGLTVEAQHVSWGSGDPLRLALQPGSKEACARACRAAGPDCAWYNYYTLGSDVRVGSWPGSSMAAAVGNPSFCRHR